MSNDKTPELKVPKGAPVKPKDFQPLSQPSKSNMTSTHNSGPVGGFLAPRGVKNEPKASISPSNSGGKEGAKKDKTSTSKG